MNGKHVTIRPLSFNTCSRVASIESVDVVYGIGAAVKTVVVYNCPLYHHKCESARFGICCQHLNRDDE